ncbi:IS200/IS605 family transposase [Streptomyces sp. NBC_01727]|uniref:IS200/IS605 family transposase n=1 Tax=unclassified Streptomyces TaxID=2593676 RepID=UPI002E149565|nr:IS200/IS605 family transposase [Streptomyces sp. NBC_01727]
MTKHRHTILTDTHLTRMEETTHAVRTDYEFELTEFNSENNHVQLLVNFPPKAALSKRVNTIKGISTRSLRQEYPKLVQHYWQAQRLWPGPHFAGWGCRALRCRPARRARRGASPRRPGPGSRRGSPGRAAGRAST